MQALRRMDQQTAGRLKATRGGATTVKKIVLIVFVALVLPLCVTAQNRPQASPQSADAVPMAVSTALEASHIAKASGGNFYGIFGYNSKTTAQFIHCYNSATLPADTAVPRITFAVGA